jgi:hypothetical protein
MYMIHDYMDKVCLLVVDIYYFLFLPHLIELCLYAGVKNRTNDHPFKGFKILTILINLLLIFLVIFWS